VQVSAKVARLEKGVWRKRREKGGQTQRFPPRILFVNQCVSRNALTLQIMGLQIMESDTIIFHPIKSFDQLKQSLSSRYAGDVLWDKVAEAAKKNTQREAVGCFVAGTLVHTKEGLRPIEQIKVGDYVLSKPEDGSGETAYKQVINTFEFDDKEYWYLVWSDPAMLRSGISTEEFIAHHGQSFAITTPNHPFWVVSSDEYLRWDDRYPYEDGQLPQQQWVRADHVAPGMVLMLASGRIVTVGASRRVYKTNSEQDGWVDSTGFESRGLIVSFTNGSINPHMPIHANRYQPVSVSHGLIENPNESYADDQPPGNAPESWYRGRVYNLEVEDFHTYFVDKLGVWVHNTNCGHEQLA
jgi:Pretoxin HINT domain